MKKTRGKKKSIELSHSQNQLDFKERFVSYKLHIYNTYLEK